MDRERLALLSIMPARPPLILVLALALLLATAPGAASEYSPPGLYDLDYAVLPNGLRVALKPRAGAHNVSVRLAVGVGDLDFPCGKQQTPHLLEHLLFSGTSTSTETALDARIEDHGGYWNAHTTQEQTIYELDIYSLHVDVGLRTLHEIVLDSQLAPESVEAARAIVHREMGGRPSTLRQWLATRGVGENATSRAVAWLLPGSNYICPGIDTAQSITREELLAAYRAFYVPENMTLVVVGDFELQAMRRLIAETFGALPRRALLPGATATPSWPVMGGEFTGTLAPILGTEAQVGLAFRTPGYASQEFFALHVLASHLQTRLFEAIRTERSLAYAPGAQLYTLRDFGVLLASADVDLDAMDEALEAIGAEVARLRSDGLDAQTLERTKRRILLQMAQGYESNLALADYYVDNLDELAQHGRLLNHEAAIEAVTAEDIRRIALAYLDPERAVIFRETPTLTPTQFLLALGALALVTGAALWRLAHPGLRRRRGRP